MPATLESILKIEVPVIVQIAFRRMAVREVAGFAPGSIIELPKLANEDLEILASNRIIGTGMAVKVGENFGIRITSMGNLRQRLDALGGRSDASPLPAATNEPAAAEDVKAESGESPAESGEVPTGQ